MIFSAVLRIFSLHSLMNCLQLRGIVPQRQGRQNIQKEIDRRHGKRNRKCADVTENKHRQKSRRIRKSVGKHALVALDYEFLYVLGAVRVRQLLFAESAQAAKLPYPVLPFPNLQPPIKPLFPFGYVVCRVINSEKPVGKLIYDKCDQAVKRKLQGGTQNNRDDHNSFEAFAISDLIATSRYGA